MFFFKLVIFKFYIIIIINALYVTAIMNLVNRILHFKVKMCLLKLCALFSQQYAWPARYPGG